MRRPNSFHIAVTTSGRTVNTTSVHHDHHSGSQVTIRIELPHNVNMCNLLVSIRAENSAGLSPPTEIEVGRSLHVMHHSKSNWVDTFLCMHAECPTTSDNSDSTPTTSTVTNTTSSVVNEVEEGISTYYNSCWLVIPFKRVTPLLTRIHFVLSRISE